MSDCDEIEDDFPSNEIVVPSTSKTIDDSLSNEIVIPSTSKTTKTLPLHTSQLISCLYANAQVPQNVVDTVYNGIRNIFDNSVFPHLEEQNSDSFKNSIESTFTNLDSYYKRLK